MIESAARCLKTGGRAISRASRKQLQTRRHLHSAFWSHGAGDIDLPAWWILLLQTPADGDGSQIIRDTGKLGQAMSTGLENIFLDFLYPIQTLALIRRLNRSATAQQRMAQNVTQYSRSFTSIAKDFINGVTTGKVVEADVDTRTQSSHQAATALRDVMNQLLNSKDQSNLQEKLWKNYQDMLEISEVISPQELIKMLRCLLSSKRPVDNERALALFESIPVESRRAIHYSHAVSAALSLKDVTTAVLIHREALSRINGSIGSTAILEYAVRHDLWTVAIEIWHNFWSHKLSYYTRPDIWAGVDALHVNQMIRKASAAANFALNISESEGAQRAVAAREFAMEFSRRAFSVSGTTFDENQHWRLVEKAKKLDSSNTSTRLQALNQLLSVDRQEHSHNALQLYRIIRDEAMFSPTRQTLEDITQKLLLKRNASDILMVIDDWRTHFAMLPGSIAINALKVFAEDGLLHITEKLFDDFVSEHGAPRHNRVFHLLLKVHSKRADTEGVLRCLNEMRTKFDFEPGVTAWNIVISTFARVGDVDGAVTYFQELCNSGHKPDSTTYHHLMLMYGKRGDRDAVEDLYEQSKVEGVSITPKMMNALVLVNINEGNLDEAERLIEQVLPTSVQGQRTFLWNVLINAYALRKDVEKVSVLHKRMQEKAVPLNEMTFAALMTCLTIAKYPEGGEKILETVMPRNKVKGTALHYAILMEGFLTTRRYHKVFTLYKQMLRRNLSPNMSTQNVYLRAAAMADKEDMLRQQYDGENDDIVPDQIEFVRARKTFEQTIANIDPMELAASEPRMFVGANRLDEAFTSTYFDYLVFLYGSEGALTRASELYERYIISSLPLKGSDRDVETSPPVRLVSALMAAHVRAENHVEVGRCWYLSLEKSRQIACRSRAETSGQDWVLRSRRFIVNLPLKQYITSLVAQKRTADLIITIDDLHYAGYTLTGPNWNFYIQALARSPHLNHRTLAFTLCERELIPNWSGWNSLGDLTFMNRRFRAISRSMLLRPEQKTPTYVTLVWLARAYLETVQQGKRHFEEAGPKTVDAINNMPLRNDKPQVEILRQGS